MLTFGSLFAGIGGFDRGFEDNGFQCRWQVEIDPACNRVLARHWPDVPKFRDVRECGTHNLEPVDMICAGFPCQDLSVAGKRAGLEGERSGLFFEMVRIVNELRPTFLVWENVCGLLSSNGGRDFGTVLRELDRIGLAGAWSCLDAQWFGVAQRRRRIFGVFAQSDIGAKRCAEILSLTPGSGRYSAPSRQAGARTAASLTSGSGVTSNAPGRRREDDMNLICLDDQGGSQMSICKDRVGTLRSEAHGNVPMITAYQCQGTNVGEMGTLRRGNGHVTGGVPFVTAFDWQSEGGDRCCPVRAGDYAGALGATKQDAVMIDTLQQQGYNTPNKLRGDDDGNAQEADPGKVLRILRGKVGAEAFEEWGLGVLAALRKAQILRPSVHGESVRREGQSEPDGLDGNPREGTQDSTGGAMFGLWCARCVGRASQEWGLDEQRAGQLGAYLSELSHSDSSQSEGLRHLWQAAEGLGLLRQALSEIQEVRRSIGNQDTSTQEMFGLRRSGECQGSVRKALHADEEGRDTTAISQKNSHQGGAGLVVRRLTPL